MISKQFLLCSILFLINIYNQKNLSKIYEDCFGCGLSINNTCIPMERGIEITSPMIDYNFIKCKEGLLLCAYYPYADGVFDFDQCSYNDDVRNTSKSGATIGYGFDMSKNSLTFLDDNNLSHLKDRLSVYFNIPSGKSSFDNIIKIKNENSSINSRNITKQEADDLFKITVKEEFIDELADKYDKIIFENSKTNKDVKNCLTFKRLPRAIRTAMVSLCYQSGITGCTKDAPTYWGYIQIQDFEKASEELKDYYKDSNHIDHKRRVEESKLFDSVLPTWVKSCKGCNKMDIAFILDSSGSVGISHFRLQIQFLKDFIQNFEISQKDSRIALIIYSSSVREIFNYEKYNSILEIENALDHVRYFSMGTNTADAIDYFISSVYPLTRKEESIPKLLFLLTDGKSNQELNDVSQRLKTIPINVISVGVGKSIDKNELELIASKKENVFFINDFDKIISSLNTLVEGSCNQNAQLKSEKIEEFNLVATVDNQDFNYFEFNIIDTSLTESEYTDYLGYSIEIKDLKGSTNAYGSLVNERPDSFKNDLAIEEEGKKSLDFIIPNFNPAIPIILYFSLMGNSDEINEFQVNVEFYKSLTILSIWIFVVKILLIN